ncbi:MAG: VWA domain-containing protein [Pirellula sp.]
MAFALPIAFALACLAIPIVGFYILKIRLRRIPVSTNLFWNQIFDEKPPRSLWQNFRHLLSLLLQLLMLLLLILSIADPYFPWQLLQARRIVVVMDNSASMRATDIAPSRFDAARKSVRNLIDSLRFRDEVAIVLAGKHPDVLVGMTNHVPTLTRAIDAIELSDSPTDLNGAIELGKQLIGNHPHGQVIVFTDGCVEPVASKVPDASSGMDTREVKDLPNGSKQEQIVYRLFGTEASNVGITQFQVRRSLTDPIGYEALVAVKNASPETVKCRLELSLEDVPIDVLPLELKPQETWSRSIEKTSLAGGRLFAEVTQIHAATEASQASSASSASALSADAPSTRQASKGAVTARLSSLNQLGTDDSAWAILPPRKVQKVLIVSPGNLFLQKVFQANPLVQVEVTKEFPPQWPTDGIIVLHGQAPETLPTGKLLVIDPANSTDYWTVGGALENPIVTEQDKNSPLMTHIRLDNVLMPQTKQIQFTSPPHALASTVSSDVVYAEVKRTNGKCLVLAVNLDQSDLAFRTAFPIMVTNALGWFAGQTGEMLQANSTGSSAIIRLAEDKAKSSDALLLISPTKQRLPLNALPESLERPMLASPDPNAANPPAPSTSFSNSLVGRVGPLNEAGIWRIVQAPKSERDFNLDEIESIAELAVNLSNPRETDLNPDKDLSESQQSGFLAATWLSRPAWFYLVIAACALTAIEWFLYQRRLIT